MSARTRGGYAVVNWKKNEPDELEIWADRNDGKGWVFFAISATTEITDNSPLPDVPTIWLYKAIYRLRGEQVGLWSDVISISVGDRQSS